MKIFYTSPYSGRNKYQEIYDEIIHCLQIADDVEVISLEVLDYKDILSKEKLDKLSGVELHTEYLRTAISLCDAAIIEASHNSFKIGYEASLVLSYNKPLLCISMNVDYSKYITDPLFYFSQPNGLEEINGLVQNFLEEVRHKHLRIRLNSLISAEQKNFLEWCSNKTGRSKAEIIRNLIDFEKTKFPSYSKEDK